MSELTDFEWHDLPLQSITIDEDGLLIVATPFNDEADAYGRAELRLTEIESITFDISETLTQKDLQNLDIGNFEYAVSADGRLSGRIGILPAGRGYWTISFTSAAYSLVTVGLAGG